MRSISVVIKELIHGKDVFPPDSGRINQYCETCGYSFVTETSHRCRGLKGRPWIVLPLTPERIQLWAQSEAFLVWAKKNGVGVKRPVINVANEKGQENSTCQ